MRLCFRLPLLALVLPLSIECQGGADEAWAHG